MTRGMARMSRNNSESPESRAWALRDRNLVSPQTHLARNMRRVPTNAERKLWMQLRQLSPQGSHFRRQVRLGTYIVDFASYAARLVIEVDGGQHAENRSDAERTKYIEDQGYRVLRFWNNDLLGNIDGVLEVIQTAMSRSPHLPAESNSIRDASSPSPLVGEGRGGGARGCGTEVPHTKTPTPDPSPQGGGEPNAVSPGSQNERHP
jgi:very-short-patch-repair endonuclease